MALTDRMPQQIAVVFALCAFAVSVASGMLTQAPATTVLLRAIVVLLAAGAMGRVLGHMAMVAVREHVAATTANNPIPKPVRIPEPAGGQGEVEVLEG